MQEIFKALQQVHNQDDSYTEEIVPVLEQK
jgi:hypothetical protein